MNYTKLLQQMTGHGYKPAKTPTTAKPTTMKCASTCCPPKTKAQVLRKGGIKCVKLTTTKPKG